MGNEGWIVNEETILFGTLLMINGAAQNVADSNVNTQHEFSRSVLSNDVKRLSVIERKLFPFQLSSLMCFHLR